MTGKRRFIRGLSKLDLMITRCPCGYLTIHGFHQQVAWIYEATRAKAVLKCESCGEDRSRWYEIEEEAEVTTEEKIVSPEERLLRAEAFLLKLQTLGAAVATLSRVEFRYKNHRCEDGQRRVVPTRLIYGTAPDWHPEPCWLLIGIDADRVAERSFAVENISDLTVPS